MNNDLFPFPGADDEEDVVKPDLPVFPATATDGQALSPFEVKQLRKIIKLFENSQPQEFLEKAGIKAPDEQKQELPVFPAAPFNESETSSEPPATPAREAQKSSEMRRYMLEFFDAAAVAEVWEIQARGEFKAILSEIDDEKCFTNVFAAIVGIFPAKKCLRRCTPDQKIYALVAISERFLLTLSGQVFPARKKLLKTAAAYLSSVSDQYSFIQMENETFSPQYHERVAGSSATGRTIREMHGFVVVPTNNRQQVFVRGQVLT